MHLPSPTSLNPFLAEWHLRTAQATGQIVRDPIQQVIQKSLDASCTVMVQAGSQEWTGSGFHIGGGLVITASHVAPPELGQAPHQIAVTFDGGQFYAAQVGISEPNYDAAVLMVPEAAQGIASVNLGDSEQVQVGDIIAVIGAPEGWHDTVTVGRISNVHQQLGPYAPSEAWNDIIFVDADILEGASGGMVVGTDGDVYGLVMGVTGRYAQLGIGQRAVCPSNKIRALVSKVRHGF